MVAFSVLFIAINGYILVTRARPLRSGNLALDFSLDKTTPALLGPFFGHNTVGAHERFRQHAAISI